MKGNSSLYKEGTQLFMGLQEAENFKVYHVAEGSAETFASEFKSILFGDQNAVGCLVASTTTYSYHKFSEQV